MPLKLSLPAVVLVLTLPLMAAVPGIHSQRDKFERDAFDKLVASKAALDEAQKEYEDAKIHQTRCAYTLIDSGKQARTAAEDAMVVYEQELKDGKGDIDSQQGVVTLDLRILFDLLGEVKDLLAHPDTKCPHE